MVPDNNVTGTTPDAGVDCLRYRPGQANRHRITSATSEAADLAVGWPLRKRIPTAALPQQRTLESSTSAAIDRAL